MSANPHARQQRDVSVILQVVLLHHMMSHQHLLRRILARFRTGLHWLHIESRPHEKLDKDDRPNLRAQVCEPGLPKHQFDSFDSDEAVADPVEHRVIFDGPEYMCARKTLPDLFNSSVVLIGHFLTQVKTMRMDMAYSAGSLPGPKQTLNVSSSSSSSSSCRLDAVLPQYFHCQYGYWTRN